MVNFKAFSEWLCASRQNPQTTLLVPAAQAGSVQEQLVLLPFSPPPNFHSVPCSLHSVSWSSLPLALSSLFYSLWAHDRGEARRGDCRHCRVPSPWWLSSRRRKTPFAGAERELGEDQSPASVSPDTFQRYLTRDSFALGLSFPTG